MLLIHQIILNFCTYNKIQIQLHNIDGYNYGRKRYIMLNLYVFLHKLSFNK